MKMKKRESIVEKRSKVMKEMNKKKQVTEKNIYNNKFQKENQSKERLGKSVEKNKQILYKIQAHHEKLEEKRLEDQKRIQIKGKLILIVVEHFSNNNLNHLINIRETFANRINKSMTNFQSNMKEIQLQNFEIEKEKKNKQFQKFEKFVNLNINFSISI